MEIQKIKEKSYSFVHHYFHYDGRCPKIYYNVKLMKGYGVSINLKENRICLKVARIHSQASKKLKNGMFLKYRMKIVIFGKGCLSTEAIKPLTDHNIDIILTDTHIFLDQIF